ncbi:tetratricopeptide repeat protein [Nannocystaceae bacterium ST9]
MSSSGSTPRRSRCLGARSRSSKPRSDPITQNNLGNAHQGLGERERALASYREAERVWELNLGRDHPNISAVRVNLGILQAEQGDFEAAHASFERALAIWERALGPDHPHLAHALVGLGDAQRELGRLTEARVSLERALAIRMANPVASELAAARFALARLEWASGQPERAHELARAALDGFRDAGPGNDDAVAMVETWTSEHRFLENDS